MLPHSKSSKSKSECYETEHVISTRTPRLRQYCNGANSTLWIGGAASMHPVNHQWKGRPNAAGGYPSCPLPPRGCAPSPSMCTWAPLAWQRLCCTLPILQLVWSLALMHERDSVYRFLISWVSCKMSTIMQFLIGLLSICSLAGSREAVLCDGANRAAPPLSQLRGAQGE